MSEAYNPFSLRGKTILVTGASSGIGQATAVECSKLGARLAVCARNPERLQETFTQLEGEGHSQIIAELAVRPGKSRRSSIRSLQNTYLPMMQELADKYTENEATDGTSPSVIAAMKTTEKLFEDYGAEFRFF